MKVYVIQTDATNTMASVINPRTGELCFAGAILDAIEFVKKAIISLDDGKK